MGVQDKRAKKLAESLDVFARGISTDSDVLLLCCVVFVSVCLCLAFLFLLLWRRREMLARQREQERLWQAELM